MRTHWLNTPAHEMPEYPDTAAAGAPPPPSPPPPSDFDDVEDREVVIRREVHHTEVEVYTYLPRRPRDTW